jgi:hypothetical protein
MLVDSCQVHFLDSPEQALLVTPLWAPIKPRGGGTYIATDGIELIANYLAEHPEGVVPSGRKPIDLRMYRSSCI